MRPLASALTLVLLPAFSAAFLIGQQAATPQTILAGTLRLLGPNSAQGLTLSGNVDSIAGATEESGTFTATCGANGSSQVQTQLSNGSRTESRQNSNAIPSGSWIDEKGSSHPMASHNLYSPSSWFCPGVTISQALSGNNLNIQFNGNEEKGGATLAHFSVSFDTTDTSPSADPRGHLSQTEIFLDLKTFRPVYFDFNMHPENDSSIDIPIEIQFADYTNVNGMWIPYTVQRYINSSLELTLHVKSAGQN